MVSNPQRRHEFQLWPLDGAVGSLMGLAIGDAMGVTQKIFPRASREHTIDLVLQQREQLRSAPQTMMQGSGSCHNNGIILERGDFTDDTSMALCLADSLLIKQKLDLSDLMQRFLDWWDYGYNASVQVNVNGRSIGRPVGLSGNLGLALQRFRADPSNPMVGGTNSNRDAGNGAIVRMAPVAIYWHQDLLEAMKMAQAQATVTHNVDEAKDGCALMAWIICCAINQVPQHVIFHNLYKISPHLTSADIIELASPDAAWKTKSESQIITLLGRTLWSLEAALWCLYHTNSFREAIIKAINLGGDADTIGAITGQMAGAIYGLRGIPSEWIHQLKHNQAIQIKAVGLFHRLPYTQEMDLMAF